jgi:hypothetical protein
MRMNDTAETFVTCEPDSPDPSRPTGNAAVSRCILASQRAYNKTFAATKNDYQGEKAARKAYLRALPPLAGYRNIADFIACVTYAMVTEMVDSSVALDYLSAAKIAILILRCTPQPSREIDPPAPKLNKEKDFIPPGGMVSDITPSQSTKPSKNPVKKTQKMSPTSAPKTLPSPAPPSRQHEERQHEERVHQERVPHPSSAFCSKGGSPRPAPSRSCTGARRQPANQRTCAAAHANPRTRYRLQPPSHRNLY